MAASGAPSPEGTSTLECLDDNELEAVFHAVKEHPRLLARLASTCGRFNELARKRMPVKLHLYPNNIRQLLHSLSLPFSACRSLRFDINSQVDLNLASAVVVHFADSWQQVEEVEIALLQERVEQLVLDDEYGYVLSEDATTTGLLGCLQGLRQLARLRLICPTLGRSSIFALGKLTSLRSLALTYTEERGRHDNWTALRALRCLTRLAVTGGARTQGGPAAVEDTGGPVLPPTLQELHVDSQIVAPSWWSHLAGCPDLLVLSVSYGLSTQLAQCHPRNVVAAVAEHCRHLTRLELSVPAHDVCWYNEGADPLLDPWHPCEGLAGLRNLRHIDCTGACQLVLGSAPDWRVLGTLQQLTALYGWKATAPPPAGLKLPAVLKPYGTCEEEEGVEHVLQGLLKACPELQTMDVAVVLQPHHPPAPGWQEQEPQQQQQQHQNHQQQQQQPSAQQQVPGQPPLPQPPPLQQQPVAGDIQSSAAVVILRYPEDGGVADTSVSTHFSAVARGLGSVRKLTLAWPLFRGHLEVLPDLSPLTHLETFRLHGQVHYNGVEQEPEGYQPDQQVLTMLLPVRATLQTLELAEVEGVGPGVALLLQEHFLKLTWINITGSDLAWGDVHGNPMDYAQQQEWRDVKAALRPGLHLLQGLPPYREISL